MTTEYEIEQSIEADRQAKKETARHCSECACTHHWGFRAKGIGAPWLCDVCWGYCYGDETCDRCEKQCYEEDWDTTRNMFLCGHCR